MTNIGSIHHRRVLPSIEKIWRMVPIRIAIFEGVCLSATVASLYNYTAAIADLPATRPSPRILALSMRKLSM